MEWKEAPPPWPYGQFFGNCEDCGDLMDTEDVAWWRSEDNGRIVTLHGVCEVCADLRQMVCP